MQYKVLEIFDEDYGCEGIEEGEEPMCNIVLSDNNGNRKIMKLSEQYIVEKMISEGDIIDFLE